VQTENSINNMVVGAFCDFLHKVDFGVFGGASAGRQIFLKRYSK
jgi:hypothetical protein